MQHNGSLWADIFLVRDGASPDPSSPKFDPKLVHHARKRKSPKSYHVWFIEHSAPGLTKYIPKTKVRKVKNLLKGAQDDDAEVEEEQVCIAI